jgi:DNA invertase Pin-like site-specific DNA recombinase
MRPGFQAMMREALQKKVDIVMAEALDRFSRDQEDTAGLFKRLTFAGVNIVTLAEGDITHLHIGLKGTMNALFLKELAEKTRRGLRGRIELGKAGGGVSFGYRIVRRLESGAVSTGEREIVPDEAAIVRRIFNDYRTGASPKQIAKALNADGVRGPRGSLWSPSTIHGNPERGIGILHNELYIGRLVWNRQRFLKDPDTGKRVARTNPLSEWITKDVPELRIIDDEVWRAVQTRFHQGGFGGGYLVSIKASVDEGRIRIGYVHESTSGSTPPDVYQASLPTYEFRWVVIGGPPPDLSLHGAVY